MSVPAADGDLLEATVVVESYNLAEGGAEARLRQALDAAVDLARDVGGEVLLTDATADARVHELVASVYPTVRLVDAVGLDYDDAKMKAAREARGRYVLYLDGDCIPNREWLRCHLAALHAGAAATAGFTRYGRGGFLASLATVLDFGFLLPAKERTLGCYAFNNAGFRRDVLLETPSPPGPMRSRCYPHAQLLARRGAPVRMVPDAVNDHEPQPFFRERFRQGFDTVAACWVDASLPEARLLGLGMLAAPVFYARTVAFDWTRVVAGRRDLGLSRAQAALGLALLPALRLVDLAGIARALAAGGRRRRYELPYGIASTTERG